MTEPLFEIISISKPQDSNSSAEVPRYLSLLQTYSQTSYGLYTEQFLRKISEKVSQRHRNVNQCELKRQLRKCVKKYLMTDLQLVFVDHYCELGQWDYRSQQIVNYFKKNKKEDEINPELSLFLEFNSFFVKSYVGKKCQFSSIKKYLEENEPNFFSTFVTWIQSKPKQQFIVSPRQINEVYGQYSKFCQTQSNQKDYNQMVDTLIDLSTSYSIIPNKINQGAKTKNKKKSGRPQQKEEQIVSFYQSKSSSRNKSKKSQICKINEENAQSELNQNDYSFHNSKNQRKSSSFMLESLQFLSKKSQQLIAENKKKGEEKQQQKHDQQQPERSRQKRPAKISLNFNRTSKPNEAVLGYIKQPTHLSMRPDPKTRSKDYSFLNNQSIRENSMSFLNMRSNRSSRSNSQLPFPWAPFEDGFFDKSKLN